MKNKAILHLSDTPAMALHMLVADNCPQSQLSNLNSSL